MKPPQDRWPGPSPPTKLTTRTGRTVATKDGMFRSLPSSWRPPAVRSLGRREVRTCEFQVRSHLIGHEDKSDMQERTTPLNVKPQTCLARSSILLFFWNAWNGGLKPRTFRPCLLSLRIGVVRTNRLTSQVHEVNDLWGDRAQKGCNCTIS